MTNFEDVLPHTEIINPNPSVDDLTTCFTTQLTKTMNRIFPVKTVRCHQSDKPWITPEIKLMIKDRQKAFHCGNVLIWQSMKCKVQKEIIARKKSFYKYLRKYLRKDDSRKWWNVVNKMSGRPTRASNFSFERDGNIMSQHDLVKTLNEFFVSVNSDIPALDVNMLPSFLPAKERIPTIQPYEVNKKMRAIKPFKAHGPDEVPCYLVREFAYELAEPVTMIFNESLKSGIVPAIWKDSNVTPISKTYQPVHESIFDLFH